MLVWCEKLVRRRQSLTRVAASRSCHRQLKKNKVLVWSLWDSVQQNHILAKHKTLFYVISYCGKSRLQPVVRKNDNTELSCFLQKYSRIQMWNVWSSLEKGNYENIKKIILVQLFLLLNYLINSMYKYKKRRNDH